MTYKLEVEKHVESLGLKLCHYDKAIDKLTKKAFKEVLENILDMNSTDIVVKVRSQFYVVEVAVCDDEVDLVLYTKERYIDKYGDEYEYKFE